MSSTEVIWWHLKKDREVPDEVWKGREFPSKGNSKIKGSDVGACMARTKEEYIESGKVRDETTPSTKMWTLSRSKKELLKSSVLSRA